MLEMSFVAVHLDC